MQNAEHTITKQFVIAAMATLVIRSHNVQSYNVSIIEMCIKNYYMDITLHKLKLLLFNINISHA